MVGRQRSSRLEWESRCQTVISMLRLALDTMQIVSSIMEQYKVSERQAFNYLAEARKRLVEKGQDDPAYFFGLQESRLEMCLQHCMAAKPMNWEAFPKIIDSLVNLKAKQGRHPHGYRTHQDDREERHLQAAMDFIADKVRSAEESGGTA